MDSRLLRDVPGYDLYQASALPFGPLSQDFACPGSATSKNVCELAGNLTVRCCPLSMAQTPQEGMGRALCLLSVPMMPEFVWFCRVRIPVLEE
jgi:hypothetical protein